MRRNLKLKVVLSAGLLVLWLASMLLASDLIEPTRILQGTKNATGSLTILSEPPNLSATLDDTPIGNTPVFFENIKSGIYTLRVHDTETNIEVKPNATLKISLFKGKFISIPVEGKKPNKRQTSEQITIDETRTGRQHKKKERQKDLTPWEKYLDGSLDHF